MNESLDAQVASRNITCISVARLNGFNITVDEKREEEGTEWLEDNCPGTKRECAVHDKQRRTCIQPIFRIRYRGSTYSIYTILG